MPEFRYDKTTGMEFIKNAQGEWEPFTDAEGAIDSALINTGAAMTQMGRGLMDMLGLEDREVLQQRQRDDDALMANLREARPVSSFIGDALPGLATLPIGGTALMAGKLGTGAAVALSTGLAGLEGFLRLDPNSVNQVGSTITGAIGGLFGEGLGRSAGRVGNAIMGMGSSMARNPAASKLAEQGFETLPSERLNVPGQNVAPLQRLEQGAQTGVFVPGVFERTQVQRRGLMNDKAAASIGLGDVDVSEGLNPSMLSEANDRLSQGFSDLIGETMEDGQSRIFKINDELAERIVNTKGQIPDLIKRGKFQGLSADGGGQLQGKEMMVARRALAQDAADAAGRGKHELAEDIWEDVNQLDELFADTISDAASPGRGQELLAEHAKLRQQYRNLQILQGSGVINDAGDVVPKSLNRKLGQGTGYGAQYKQNRPDNLLPETQELFDTTRTLSDPTLQPFRSSGTAENQAVRDLGSAVAGAVADPVAGGAGLLTRVAAPAALSMLGGTNRAANAAGGLLMPGGNLAGRAGGETAPTLVDLLLQEHLAGQQ